jgi:polysaccharide export outer membrane protein
MAVGNGAVGLLAAGLLIVSVLAACSGPTAAPAVQDEAFGTVPSYRIGALDDLDIFVYGEPGLSSSVTVRPDGFITTPLVEDLRAVGKTPAELARDIEAALSAYVVDPRVQVTVAGFSGAFDQQIRIVGEAAQPVAIPYRANMTLLDVVIAAGGLTPFAAGNRSVLVRGSGPGQQVLGVRLDDLVRDGDITANVPMVPGDVLIIPQSLF